MKATARLLASALLLGFAALVPLCAGDKDKPKDKPKTDGDKPKLDIVHTFKGHGAEVYSVAFSPDGKMLATGSFDFTVKLWDTASGKEIKTFAGAAGHTKQVLSVAFSPDGQFIASAGADNTLKVWDVPVNHPLRSLPLPDNALAVALSPDGTKLAAGTKDGKVRVFAPADFKELYKLEPGHDGPVTGLAFSANNALLVSAGADRTLRYWNATNGQPIAVIGAHTAAVNGVAIHPGNAAVYSVGDDGTLKFWAFAPTASRVLPAHAGAIKAMAVTPDAATVFTASEDKVIRQSLTAGKEVRTFPGLLAAPRSLAAGTFLAAGSVDGKLSLFDLKDGKLVSQPVAHAGAVTDVSFHPGNTQLASVGDDGLVKIWAMPPVAPRVLTHPDNPTVAVASPDGKKFFTGGADKIVRVWDAGLKIERQFTGHSAPVTALAVTGATLVSGGADGAIRFWNLTTGKEAESMQGHGGAVTSLAFNPAGNLLLSSSEDGSVRIWQLPLTPAKTMLHPDQVTCLALTADGAKMITGGADKQVRLWNLATGAKEKDFPGPTLAVSAVALTPTASLIAAGSADKSLTIWAADGKQLQKIMLSAAVQAVALSPDGKTAAAGLADGAIKLLGVGDGKEVKTISVHKGPVTALVYTPKGDALLSASADKTIQVINAADGNVRGKIDAPGPVTALTLSKDGARIAAVVEKAVKLWTLADSKEAGGFPLAVETKGIAFSPDGARLVLGGADKLTRIVEADGKLVEAFPSDGPVQAVGFVDAKRVVGAGADKTARVWTTALAWQKSHAGPVRQAIFSPKGEQVLSAGDDKTVKVFNTPDGKELRSLTVHDGPVVGLGISGDGTRLVTAGADKTAKVWNLLAKPEDTKPAAVLPLPGAPQALALNGAGNRLAVATAEPAIRVFDLALGREIQTLPDHAVPVKSLTFLGDNRTLLTAAADKTARLLDVGVLSMFDAHPGGAVSVQYHSSGNQLLTAGKDKTVKLWDLTKNAMLKAFPMPDDIKQATFSKDFTLLGAAVGKTVKVWNPADGKDVVNLAHPVLVRALSFNGDKTRIVTGAADKQTRLWDVATGKELQFFPQEDAVEAVFVDPKGAVVISAAGKTPRVDAPANLKVVDADKGPVFAVAVTSNSTHILTGGADKNAKLWNITTGALEKSFPSGADVKAVAVNKAVQLVATGGTDQVIRVFTFADGKEIGSVKAGAPVTALTFTPNNAVLAAAGADKSLQTWNTPFTPGAPMLAKDFLTPVQAWQAAAEIKEIVFAADNATIYTAGLDKAVQVWKLASPAPVANFAHPNIVDCVAFQPVKGSNLLVSGGHDGKVRLFDYVKKAQTKEVTVSTSKDATMVYQVVFTPDGKQFVTANNDRTLKLFDSAGTVVREFKAHKEKEFLKGHTDPVFSAAISPDAALLASGSTGFEGVIKIWDMKDGNVLRDLQNPGIKVPPMTPVRSHPVSVYQLRFTKDGKLISVGDAPLNKGFLAVWDVKDGKMLLGETLPMGCFFGLDISPDGTLLAIGAGPRGRPTPEFNSAYLVRLPLK